MLLLFLLDYAQMCSALLEINVPRSFWGAITGNLGLSPVSGDELIDDTAPSWQAESSRRSLGRLQPCVRPVCAVHMTAGHNAFRGSGPVQKPAFEMHWHKWVVLIAGSTGSALRAVGSPNLHITPDVGAIGHAASATGSL